MRPNAADVAGVLPPELARAARLTWLCDTATASGAPDDDQGAVVAAVDGALHGRHQVRRARSEAVDDQALSLAEEALDALVDVLARGLDEAVGVEHDRVTAAQHALVGYVGDGGQIGHDAEDDPPGAAKPPLAGVGVEPGGGRVPGRVERVLPRGEVDRHVDGGHEALVGVPTAQV